MNFSRFTAVQYETRLRNLKIKLFADLVGKTVLNQKNNKIYTINKWDPTRGCYRLINDNAEQIWANPFSIKLID